MASRFVPWLSTFHSSKMTKLTMQKLVIFSYDFYQYYTEIHVICSETRWDRFCKIGKFRSQQTYILLAIFKFFSIQTKVFHGNAVKMAKLKEDQAQALLASKNFAGKLKFITLLVIVRVWNFAGNFSLEPPLMIHQPPPEISHVTNYAGIWQKFKTQF